MPINGMTKISALKKYSLFRDFKKKLKLCKNELETKFQARVDNAYRIYNVINIPAESIGEPYNLRKADIDMIAENSIRQYSQEISKFLNEKGLAELYDFYEVAKVDKYSYLVVIGFSLFRTNKYYDTIRWKVLPITISVIVILLLILLLI